MTKFRNLPIRGWKHRFSKSMNECIIKELEKSFKTRKQCTEASRKLNLEPISTSALKPSQRKCIKQSTLHFHNSNCLHETCQMNASLSIILTSRKYKHHIWEKQIRDAPQVKMWYVQISLESTGQFFLMLSWHTSNMFLPLGLKPKP